MKLRFLIALLLLPACTSYTDLGSNFKLYEYDRDDVFVGYCFNDCEVSSIPVIPRKVVKINHNSDWIVAEIEGDSSQSGYWVVDKNVEAEFCYDCGFFYDSLQANVHGPLNVEGFEAMLETEKIALRLTE